MPRPIALVLRPHALAHNLQLIRAATPADRRLWAVAKADAYGHGVAHAVEAFAAADGLAVLDLAEAEAARALGWTKPILLLEGLFGPADVSRVLAIEADLVFHHARQFSWWREPLEAGLVSNNIRHWLKLNTGMNRLGFKTADAPVLKAAAETLRNSGHAVGWLTHFARAEEPGGTDSQRQVFCDWLDALDVPPHEARSTCNSAATWCGLAQPAEWVRPGLSLYGASPFASDAGRSASGLGLMAAASLETQVISIQALNIGETVGYGSRWTAMRPSRIGVVAAGYADGYPRTAPDGTPVLVRGCRCPLVGQVSMDMLTVDLTDHPHLDEADPVTLWGDGLGVDEVAAACGTTAYELLTGVTPRVPRHTGG
jgi:alanine racemase